MLNILKVQDHNNKVSLVVYNFFLSLLWSTLQVKGLDTLPHSLEKLCPNLTDDLVLNLYTFFHHEMAWIYKSTFCIYVLFWEFYEQKNSVVSICNDNWNNENDGVFSFYIFFVFVLDRNSVWLIKRVIQAIVYPVSLNLASSG